MQLIRHPAPLELGAAADEAPRMDEPAFALAVGEDVKTLLEHAAEELRTPPAAIEDDRDLALPDRGAHLAQQLGESLGEGGVEVGSDQRTADRPRDR